MKVRVLNILIISCIILFGMCKSGSHLGKNKLSCENEHIYPFNGKYINLNKLSVLEDDTLFVKNFKTESKYYQRFLTLEMLNKLQKELTYKGSKFSIGKDNNLTVKLKDSTIKKIENKESKIEVPDSENNNFLLPSAEGVIFIKRLLGKYGYIIYKYDENAKEIFNTLIKHTYMVIRGGNITYHPYLKYFTHTNNVIIFTSFERAYDKTHVISLIDGSLLTYSFKVTGIIRDIDENKIKGFIDYNEETGKAKVNLLSYNWQIPKKQDVNVVNETIIKDDIIVISDYSPITSGSTLTAYNLKTGILLWNADVKQLNAEHSKYSNSVILSLYKNKVILEGNESSGKYLQIFDLKSGKRLFEKINKE